MRQARCQAAGSDKLINYWGYAGWRRWKDVCTPLPNALPKTPVSDQPDTTCCTQHTADRDSDTPHRHVWCGRVQLTEMWLFGKHQHTSAILVLLAAVSFHHAGSFVAPAYCTPTGHTAITTAAAAAAVSVLLPLYIIYIYMCVTNDRGVIIAYRAELHQQTLCM